MASLKIVETAAAFAVADLRHQLIANGYVPIPVAGKSPRIVGWQKLKPLADHVDGLIRAHPDHNNTGLLTGDLVAIDIDAPDAPTSMKLVEMVLDLPWGTASPCRVGKAPKCLFIFRATAPRKKATTGKFLINDKRCEVEVLGIGNQFVAYGIHPDTNAPYDWSNGEPTEVAFADLPEITPETLDTFLAAARELLAARGEPEASKKKPAAANDNRPPAAAGDGPWADIKTRAFADLDAWVPALGLDRLRRYQDGFLAVASFRPSRRAGLATAKRGQALEISPAGICDHSDGNKGYSPIGLVAVCLGLEPGAAADWLRDRVGGGARVDTTPPVAHVALLANHKGNGKGKDVPVAANDNDRFASIDADTLLGMTFSPVKYVVPGYLAEGLTLLGGRPKLGKSWLALGFCVAVASGGSTLGVECEPGDVLYCALEDNQRRLQDRLRTVIPRLKSMRPSLSRLRLQTEAPKVGAGLVEMLDAWRQSVADPRLIVIDTLAMVRPPKKGNQDAYSADYEAISPLQRFASEHRIAVIAVTHVRKAEADDPLEMISGTNGLTGAADSTMVLSRDSDGAKLYGRGRDVEEIEKALRFEDGRWTALGDADDVKRSGERRKIMAAMNDAGRALTPAEIAEATEMKPANVRYLLRKMVEAGEAEKCGYGAYKSV
ncbi:AAA family ATPase [Aurantimonas sp. A3-2-R12]|uniref:AAA family ATPase n=1 Tax=Aurantimonas sp. A3-2-R12 TaxID=3114362 RepID=UPI002E19581C|nr:AAA family ATPase [Aurantimonas sp. A3-2-R12]